MDGGVRLALESKRPTADIATDLAIQPEALRKCVRRAEVELASVRGCALISARSW